MIRSVILLAFVAFFVGIEAELKENYDGYNAQ
jgi:hypothetical protein